MKTINALAFRQRFGKVIDEVHDQQRPIVISRANKPMAVLVPYELYEAGNVSSDISMVRDHILQWRVRNKPLTEKMDSATLVRKERDAR